MTNDTMRRLNKNGMIQSTPTDLLLRDDDVWKAEGHLDGKDLVFHASPEYSHEY